MSLCLQAAAAAAADVALPRFSFLPQVGYCLLLACCCHPSCSGGLRGDRQAGRQPGSQVGRQTGENGWGINRFAPNFENVDSAAIEIFSVVGM
jgi:hypothetical protein